MIFLCPNITCESFGDPEDLETDADGDLICEDHGRCRGCETYMATAQEFREAANR